MDPSSSSGRPPHPARAGTAVLLAAGLVAAALLSACGGGADGAPAAPAAAAPPVVVAAESDADAGDSIDDSLLALVNAQRAAGRSCGGVARPAVGPLRLDAAVKVAAAEQAAWIQSTGVLSHAGEGGSTAADRLSDTGYAWSAVGENVAMGYGTAEAALQGWLDSAGHCDNLMNGSFVDIGLDHRAAADGRPSSSAMVLARPR